MVIGIDNYQNDNINDLKGAVRDAKKVAAELKKRGISVKTFINKNATQRAIKAYLGDKLPGIVQENERVIVYFAGHGVSMGSGEAAMGYLLPVDADRNSLRATGISMREIQAWFQDYRAKHVMFVADACYSGLALNTRATGIPANVREYLKLITSKPVRVALVAGGSGEEANEWRGQGLFTYYFLEGIGGAADADQNGIITSDELSAYIKPNVAQTAMNEFRAKQNPQLGRRGEGEFIFLNPRGAAVNELEPPPVVCPEGSELEEGKCVAITAVGCQDGMRFEPGRGCIPFVNASCPEGMVYIPEQGCRPSISDTPPHEPVVGTIEQVPEDKTHDDLKTWGHVAFWTGIASVALGGMATGLAASYGEQGCSDQSEPYCDRSKNWAGVMWAGYGVGAALLATGISLWALSAKKKKPSKTVLLNPHYGKDNFGLVLSGWW